jgi:hypothetical protein
MQYVYHTNCVNSDCESINNLIDSGIEIAYSTFIKKVSIKQIKEIFCNLSVSLKNDWHVRYYKGKYQGKDCVYMVHSSIENIFLKNNG